MASRADPVRDRWHGYKSDVRVPRSEPGRTPFVITPYVPDAEGVLQPKLPTSGPCGSEGEAVCRLGVHHRRDRRTGPCFPLAVMQCRTHARAFTLYPSGHVPYGREAIAPVSADGAWLDREPEAFSGTAFDAAIDAAAGRAWPRESTGAEGWSTQRRRVQRLARCLGTAPKLQAPQRQRIADVLVVALLIMMEQLRLVVAQPGYRSRGAAICAVLASLPRTPSTPDRLLAAGHIAGLWGQPLRWDGDHCALRPVPYRPGGTRGPPVP